MTPATAATDVTEEVKCETSDERHIDTDLDRRLEKKAY
jgi:hypothetical protein